MVFVLPLALWPSGVHPNAVKQSFPPSLLSTCPTRFYLHLRTSQLISLISAISSSHWLSVITHVFLNDLPDHFQFAFVTFNRKPWHRACRLFRTAKRQFHTFSIWYFQDILSVTVMIKFCRHFFAGRSNPWKMMANPGWIELFDRNSNERLAASKLASRKKSKQANKLESMSWSSESK